MDAQITAMTIEHYDEVYALWSRADGVALSETDSREWIVRYLDRNRSLSSVALCDGRVVGALLCGHDGRRGYLTHLAVDDAHRRKGLGRALVERSLEMLRREGIPACNLFILNSNASGRAFWQAQGWIAPDWWGVMNRRIDGQ